MKNELLQQRDCLKYWEKYGQNTFLYPLALRSGTEALLLAPHGTFPTPGREQFWTNHAFLHLAQSLPWDFGTVTVKGVRSKNTLISQGGEKKGSVCLQLAPPSGSLNKPAFPKMSGCWDDFFLLKLFLLSLGEEHMEKLARKLKLRKYFFLTRQLRVYVLLCTVPLSSHFLLWRGLCSRWGSWGLVKQ